MCNLFVLRLTVQRYNNYYVFFPTIHRFTKAVFLCLLYNKYDDWMSKHCAQTFSRHMYCPDARPLLCVYSTLLVNMFAYSLAVIVCFCYIYSTLYFHTCYCYVDRHVYSSCCACVLQVCMSWHQNGSDWPQKGQVWNF